jgi:hypothetical protein
MKVKFSDITMSELRNLHNAGFDISLDFGNEEVMATKPLVRIVK